MTKKELKELIMETISEISINRNILSPSETDTTPVDIKLTKGVARQLIYLINHQDVRNEIVKLGHVKAAKSIYDALKAAGIDLPVEK